MEQTTKGEGQCLCGKVKVTAHTMSHRVGACHCSMCRKWSGAPALSVDCGTEVTFAGEEHISVYESSAWAERGFCANCGGHLFYRLKEPRHYIMPVGLFADDGQFVFDHQVFIDEKPDFYRFANETLNMTGAEVFATYGPK
jgi:hypothetical protein